MSPPDAAATQGSPIARGAPSSATFPEALVESNTSLCIPLPRTSPSLSFDRRTRRRLRALDAATLTERGSVRGGAREPPIQQVWHRHLKAGASIARAASKRQHRVPCGVGESERLTASMRSTVRSLGPPTRSVPVGQPGMSKLAAPATRFLREKRARRLGAADRATHAPPHGGNAPQPVPNERAASR